MLILILILVFLSMVHEYAYFYEYIWKSVYCLLKTVLMWWCVCNKGKWYCWYDNQPILSWFTDGLIVSCRTFVPLKCQKGDGRKRMASHLYILLDQQHYCVEFADSVPPSLSKTQKWWHWLKIWLFVYFVLLRTIWFRSVLKAGVIYSLFGLMHHCPRR